MVVTKQLRPLTERVYQSHVSLFTRWLNSRKPTPELASEYLDWLAESGKSPSYIAVAGYAIEWKYGISVDKPKITIGEPKYISLDDVEKLISHSPTLLEKTAVIVLFDGALRISELLSLKVDSIDWDHGVITVERKGGHISRVKLTERGINALRVFLKMRRSKSPYVFMGFDYGLIYRRLKKVADKAGVRNFSPHVLRHSRIVHLLESGVPLERVSDIAGHRSIVITQSIYGRLRAEDLGKYLKGW